MPENLTDFLVNYQDSNLCVMSQKIIYFDIENKQWVECIECGHKFHCNCILHMHILTFENVQDIIFLNYCIYDSYHVFNTNMIKMSTVIMIKCACRGSL